MKTTTKPSHGQYCQLWERAKNRHLPALRFQMGEDAEDVLQEAWLGRVAGLYARMEWQGEAQCMALMGRAISFASLDWRRRHGQDARLVHQAPESVPLWEADKFMDTYTDLSAALCDRAALLERLEAIVLEERVFVVALVTGADPELIELMTGASPSEQRRRAREALERIQGKEQGKGEESVAPLARMAAAKRVRKSHAT
jgi:DNA-directed RNA polymerase specialized sigma24 family protein